MSNFNTETVLSVRHWTDTLFSFVTTRDPAFRFASGQFTMIGLKLEDRPLLRAYSIASPVYDDRLEFFSIKVQNGPLTSRLQHLKEGDAILVGRKPTGTLVHDALLPGARLYLLGTGTGLAPFLSVIRDPATYERFETVVLVHGCRFKAELAYQDLIERQLPQDELLGETVGAQLLYHPMVTREPFANQGRITDAFACGRLPFGLGLPAIAAEGDRFMLCGSPAMLADMTLWLKAQGLAEGSNATPGHYVIEKAFVER
ncbi:ferredoxin--NADP reductase [Xanthobacter sp. KR7-225]|uniref:ferredoxin--NADP reductase n=1 Tax=Xanthobacter sp. KR7-225 TaxID=3156613 RepID=UPI0032B411A3